jgi:hypothetical protein
LAQALAAVEQMILDDQATKHRFADIEKLSSRTGISQGSDFDDYFRHGGLRMGYGGDIEDVLKKANDQWFSESDDDHNVLKFHKKQWRQPVVDYIDAHRVVYQQYENQVAAFKAAVEQRTNAKPPGDL